MSTQAQQATGIQVDRLIWSLAPNNRLTIEVVDSPDLPEIIADATIPGLLGVVLMLSRPPYRVRRAAAMVTQGLEELARNELLLLHVQCGSTSLKIIPPRLSRPYPITQIQLISVDNNAKTWMIPLPIRLLDMRNVARGICQELDEGDCIGLASALYRRLMCLQVNRLCPAVAERQWYEQITAKHIADNIDRLAASD